jgi:hypothetical protein
VLRLLVREDPTIDPTFLAPLFRSLLAGDTAGRQILSLLLHFPQTPRSAFTEANIAFFDARHPPHVTRTPPRASPAEEQKRREQAEYTLEITPAAAKILSEHLSTLKQANALRCRVASDTKLDPTGIIVHAGEILKVHRFTKTFFISLSSTGRELGCVLSAVRFSPTAIRTALPPPVFDRILAATPATLTYVTSTIFHPADPLPFTVPCRVFLLKETASQRPGSRYRMDNHSWVTATEIVGSGKTLRVRIIPYRNSPEWAIVPLASLNPQ